MSTQTLAPHPFDLPDEISPFTQTVYRITGASLVLSVLGFFLPFIVLLPILQFMDRPINVEFTLFQKHGTLILLSYYGMALGGLSLILATLMMRQLVRGIHESLLLTIATVCGVLGGLMQAIGDLRWPFLLPSLATTYSDPNSSQAARSTVEVVFNAVD